MARTAPQESFTGPVFLVGMPRSGTKLLRDLLCRHPRVRMPTVETEFLPYWVENWRRYEPLNDYHRFLRFYRATTRLPYFLHMAQRGGVIDPRTWYQRCRDFGPAGVFEALIRHDAGAPTGVVWGDKSPGYILHVPLLLTLYPHARVLHLLRDVRDYCLSVHKAWGKNMIRAAQRWADAIDKVRADARAFPQSYLEIRYEDLIENPRAELRSACGFLGLEFDDRMLELTKPVEQVGDARGATYVLSANKEKYRHSMDPVTRGRIEAIARPVLSACGYAVTAGAHRRVPALRMRWYRALDGVALLGSGWRRMGLVGALRFHLRWHQAARAAPKSG